MAVFAYAVFLMMFGEKNMKIAVASDTPDYSGVVPPLFSGATHLLLVDMESGDILDIVSRSSLHGSKEAQDVSLARQILRWNCEGVLCGPIERAAFLIIADEGQVTRYNAAGMGVYEALSKAAGRELELIRDHIEGAGCRGEHKEGAGESNCECGHEH